MPVDEQHQAFPRLYGAPAYARPPSPAPDAGRPFDPDDLPLAAELAPDEVAVVDAVRAGNGALGGDGLASLLPSVGYVPSTLADDDADGGEGAALRPRPFDLRSLAARLRDLVRPG